MTITLPSSFFALLFFPCAKTLGEQKEEKRINAIRIVTARTSSKNCNKGKVTVLHTDKIGRRQRGATEACFLHVAGKRQGRRLPRLPGGEQLPRIGHALILFFIIISLFLLFSAI
ncbi:MAG: hypothetical protein OXB88_11290 [Bacteriovoracales bacterium]|nr:hypothetical protein [Bacteriovoracales bacterium]